MGRGPWRSLDSGQTALAHSFRLGPGVEYGMAGFGIRVLVCEAKVRANFLAWP